MKKLNTQKMQAIEGGMSIDRVLLAMRILLKKLNDGLVSPFKYR